MADVTGLKNALHDARNFTDDAWKAARAVNVETGYADEACRQITTLTSAALDALTRALKLAEKDVP